MRRAVLVHKPQPDRQFHLLFHGVIVKPVDAALPEKGKAGDREGDRVGKGGFALAISTGDDRRIAENKGGRLQVVLKSGECQLRNVELLYFFHSASPFQNFLKYLSQIPTPPGGLLRSGSPPAHRTQRCPAGGRTDARQSAAFPQSGRDARRGRRRPPVSRRLPPGAPAC